MKLFTHLKYILIHKYYVFIQCVKHGQPLLGLIHDVSKFLPSEFIPYAKYAYTDYFQNLHGSYQAGDSGNIEFDLGWTLHRRRNKHHWQFWIISSNPIDMEEKYIIEMLCDWMGAIKAQKNNIVVEEWYDKHKSEMSLSSGTKKVLDRLIQREKDDKIFRFDKTISGCRERDRGISNKYSQIGKVYSRRER
jgi:hypothetical protein